MLNSRNLRSILDAERTFWLTNVSFAAINVVALHVRYVTYIILFGAIVFAVVWAIGFLTGENQLSTALLDRSGILGALLFWTPISALGLFSPNEKTPDWFNLCIYSVYAGIALMGGYLVARQFR